MEVFEATKKLVANELDLRQDKGGFGRQAFGSQPRCTDHAVKIRVHVWAVDVDLVVNEVHIENVQNVLVIQFAHDSKLPQNSTAIFEISKGSVDALDGHHRLFFTSLVDRSAYHAVGAPTDDLLWNIPLLDGKFDPLDIEVDATQLIHQFFLIRHRQLEIHRLGAVATVRAGLRTAATERATSRPRRRLRRLGSVGAHSSLAMMVCGSGSVSEFTFAMHSSVSQSIPRPIFRRGARLWAGLGFVMGELTGGIAHRQRLLSGLLRAAQLTQGLPNTLGDGCLFGLPGLLGAFRGLGLRVHALLIRGAGHGI
mmetsp:Transcript_19020/g.47769  ORF Transcript_19020/g.47769 Transcript_19020/m.47769 type:complete len:310 (+) Transcript_19020:917-1846(+)